jgi:hypothetical protein
VAFPDHLLSLGNRHERRSTADRRRADDRLDLSFNDIFEDLDGAFFVTGVARRDRFVFMGDFTWAKVSQDGTFILVGFPIVSLDGEITQTSLTLAAGYSVFDQPDLVLDLVGGARGWHIDAKVSAEIDFPSPPFPGGLGASVSDEMSWVDPIIGARVFRF